jgi:hypothetical protein
MTFRRSTVPAPCSPTPRDTRSDCRRGSVKLQASATRSYRTLAGAIRRSSTSARALLLAAVPSDIVCYDWWTYMLVSRAGGLVHYEPLPAVAYRQHSSNQIGSNKGFAAALKRIKMLLLGEWVAWNDRNFAALIKNAFLLSSENREVLKAFYTMRKGRLFQRLRTWRQIGLYRQTPLGQLTLLFATIFRRL